MVTPSTRIISDPGGWLPSSLCLHSEPGPDGFPARPESGRLTIAERDLRRHAQRRSIQRPHRTGLVDACPVEQKGEVGAVRGDRGELMRLVVRRGGTLDRQVEITSRKQAARWSVPIPVARAPLACPHVRSLSLSLGRA